MNKKIITLSIITTFGITAFFLYEKINEEEYITLETNPQIDIPKQRPQQAKIVNSEPKKEVRDNLARIEEVKRKGRENSRTKSTNKPYKEYPDEREGVIPMEISESELSEYMTFYDNTLFFDQQEQISFEDSDFKNRNEILNYKHHAIFKIAPKDKMEQFFESNAMSINGKVINNVQFPILQRNGEVTFKTFQCRTQKYNGNFVCDNFNVARFYKVSDPKRNFKGNFTIIESNGDNYRQHYELSKSGQFIIYTGVKYEK